MIIPIALSAALACGFTHEPPARYFAPNAAPVRTEAVSLSELRNVCNILARANGQADIGPGHLWGCAPVGQGFIVIPTKRTWPGTDTCYRENERHETAHARGWPADHSK